MVTLHYPHLARQVSPVSLPAYRQVVYVKEQLLEPHKQPHKFNRNISFLTKDFTSVYILSTGWLQKGLKKMRFGLKKVNNFAGRQKIFFIEMLENVKE